MITKAIVKDYVARECGYLTQLELDSNSLVEKFKNIFNSISTDDDKEKVEKFFSDLKMAANEENDDDESSDEKVSALGITEVIKENKELRTMLKAFEEQLKSENNIVQKLIDEYTDFDLISRLSRQYFELKYPGQCVRCDLDGNGNEILDQKDIELNTISILNSNKYKVLFEGQIGIDDLRARFDILIVNDDGTYDLIEVKGTNDVFDHPESRIAGEKIVHYDIDKKIKIKYLYDLLFQYYLYKQNNMRFRSIGYMFTNRSFKLKNLTYPVSDNELKDLFVIKDQINLETGSMTLMDYFDTNSYKSNRIKNKTIEVIVEEIRNISMQSKLNPKKCYLCKKGGKCPFLTDCFKDADDPNSIFKLTNWKLYCGNPANTKKLMDDGIEKISDISESFVEEKYPEIKINDEPKPGEPFYKIEKYNNANSQIRYSKGEIKEKFVISLDRINAILQHDYLDESIKYLVFFDFESFQYPIPLVEDSTPWKQVVSQYSMHVVNRDYDMRGHDFDTGVGGGIKHYEYIGNPDEDKYANPSRKLYQTLRQQLIDAGINPLNNDYRVVVFNQNFESSRMQEYLKEFDQLEDDNILKFVANFRSNVVDLLDFFTTGSIYCRDFNGKGSLKTVQPKLTEDSQVLDYYDNLNLKFDMRHSLDYKKGKQCLVFNGSICLDLYKSLLIRSHLNETHKGPSTDELLKEALAYCKIDSWGTVVIFDILKHITDGTLKLDALYR